MFHRVHRFNACRFRQAQLMQVNSSKYQDYYVPDQYTMYWLVKVSIHGSSNLDLNHVILIDSDPRMISGLFLASIVLTKDPKTES